MPINIYIADTFESIKELCEDEWELPIQIHELGKWIDSVNNELELRKYVADIGFHIR